jgi:preprotein translocase subunit SecB
MAGMLAVARQTEQGPSMADVADNNGGAGAPVPSLNVLTQYVKDLSFENPDAPVSLTTRGQPAINININVNAKPLQASVPGANDFEVELKLDARAADGDRTLFAVELVYAGVFRLTNVPQEQTAPVVMIECPRMLFPFARQVIAESTRNGGFPPLLVDPVDFSALYRQSLARSGGPQPGVQPQ